MNHHIREDTFEGQIETYGEVGFNSPKETQKRNNNVITESPKKT